MSIIRSPRATANFSLISNAVIRDERLSFRARGILLEILSRPDNWSVSADSLARNGKEGRSAVLTALKELRAVGYMKTEKLRLKNGQFKTVSIIYDSTQEQHAARIGETEVDQTEVGEPKFEKPQSVNRTPLEVLSKKNYKEELFKNKDKEVQEVAIATNPIYESLANYLADCIELNGSKRPTVSDAWIKDIRLLIERDGRTPEQVQKAIDWSSNNGFWRSNILSPNKLRQKYDQLRLNAESENRSKQPKGLDTLRIMHEEETAKVWQLS